MPMWLTPDFGRRRARKIVGPIVFLIAVAMLSRSLVAQCEMPPIDPALYGQNLTTVHASDHVFFPDYPECDLDFPVTGAAACTNTIIARRWGGGQAQFEITRVVGPGSPGEFDANGELVNRSTYIANGVLGKDAYLFVSAGASNLTPGPHVQTTRVFLNGYQAGMKTFNLHETACIPISTEHMKFPQRGSGGPPTPVVNTIEFDTDDCCADLLVFYPWSLTIKAMAPVVLVHGWNSGPWEWGPEEPDAAGVCGPGRLTSDKGRATINALVSAKVPFDCLIKMDRQALIQEGAETLLSGDANGRSVKSVAATFGARHVHILTNSKGGLFTRSYLDKNRAENPSSQIAVVSVTTLDTPHWGSVLSDAVVLYNSGIRSVFPSYARVGYFFGKLSSREQLKNAFGRGNLDLTTGSVNTFNVTHEKPPEDYHVQFSNPDGVPTSSLTLKHPSYYSTSGDADLNGNHSLESNEAAPYNPLAARFQWNLIRRARTLTQGKNAQGQIVVLENRSTLPLENDTAVSVWSARYPGFVEIGSYPANHASILCPSAGSVPAFCPGGLPNPIFDVLASIQVTENGLNE